MISNSGIRYSRQDKESMRNRTTKLAVSLALAMVPFTVFAQQLEIKSDILGLCDTGNKTTLKKDLVYTHGPGDIHIYHYDENGKRVVYENEKEQCVHLDPVRYKGSAVLSLGEVDDRLIDASNAKVELVDGNGYYADEFILKANRLTGEWKEGQYVYCLKEGDLEFNTWGYDTSTDYNSGREWSIMGGDGNGVYDFTFKVSGIKYDGREVSAQTFPVAVYCYGRTCTDLALKTQFVENTYDEAYQSGVNPNDVIQWKWHTEGEQSAADKPYMNDLYTDYFTVVWPKGTDSSHIGLSDVTVKLSSPYGDVYILSAETPYGEHEYAVINGVAETTVCVLYQQWASVPVYNTLTVEIQSGKELIRKSYEISSVAATMTQTGGGGVDVDHTVTCYNYHGIGNMNEETSLNKYYTLSTEIDGETYYYAEDAQGKGYLSKGVTQKGRNMGGFGHNALSGMGPAGGPGNGAPGGMIGRGPRAQAPADAWQGDGTDIYHLAVLGNVVFVESRMDTPQETVTTEIKEVDSKKIAFKRNISTNMSATAMLERGATLEPGYNMARGGAHQWAWTKRYQAGWTKLSPQPTSLPYVDGAFPYGYEPGSPNPIYVNEME